MRLPICFYLILYLVIHAPVALSVEYGFTLPPDKWQGILHLRIEGGQCSGSAVSDIYIVTAAHCFDRTDKNTRVNVYSQKNSALSFVGTAYPVYIDNRYSEDGYAFDIEILKMDSD